MYIFSSLKTLYEYNIKGDDTMYNAFTDDAKKVLMNAKEEMVNLHHPYVGSEHLLLAILKGNNEVSTRLKNYNLNYQMFKDELLKVVGMGKKKSEYYLYTPLLKRIIEGAILDAKEQNEKVTISNLFASILEEGEGIAIRLLLGMNYDLDALYKEFAPPLTNKIKRKLLIEELGIDLTKEAALGNLDPALARDDEINTTMEILTRRKKNNPLLIGHAGVGKTAIVEEIARRIASGEIPYSLRNKRIINIDMATLVAGTKYRGEFEERINKVLKELEENNDIILFIDEIHTLVGAGGAEGAIDASNIFKPALARGKIRCIGATTIDEYKKYISADKALERRFQTVNIEEPNYDATYKILTKVKTFYEDFHNVVITDDNIKDIINYSNKYIHNRYQPDKAIDILDEVCASINIKDRKNLKMYNNLSKNLESIIDMKKDAIIKNDFKQAITLKNEENFLMDKINKLELKICNDKTKQKITLNDILKIISRKTHLPLVELKPTEVNKLVKLLKDNIIGQNKAIEEVIAGYKKYRLGFKEGCYTMLFIGPSGVGKTKTAKLFGEFITTNVLRLDMSEYSQGHSISKLIGSPAGYVGYEDNRNIFEQVKNNPNTVLILDEIDKAHRSIINLLYQIIDEGKCQDAKGDDIYFDHAIIIMTSNAGYLKNNVGFTKNSQNSFQENFDLPFINRIDKIIHFNYLQEHDIKKIINMEVKAINNKYQIKANYKRLYEILKDYKYEEQGAREIKRLVQEQLEGLIIKTGTLTI